MVAPTDLPTTTNPLLTNEQARDLLRGYKRKNRKSSRWSSIDQIVLRCRIREDCRPRTVFRDPRRTGTGKTGWFMLRVHITSRWPIIQRKGMDPWKHEDRSSTGGNSQLPPRPLRNWDQNQGRLSFLGDDRKWIEQIRNGNVRRNTRKPQWWKLEPVRRDLLPQQDRNKHHCQGHLLQQLRYYSTCVNGSTSNHESTTDTLLKFRRKWSDYHARGNDYRFDALQTNCFGINIKL